MLINYSWVVGGTLQKLVHGRINAPKAFAFKTLVVPFYPKSYVIYMIIDPEHNSDHNYYWQ
jgi:hypothetical protein